jgi:hypothetical protein
VDFVGGGIRSEARWWIPSVPSRVAPRSPILAGSGPVGVRSSSSASLSPGVLTLNMRAASACVIECIARLFPFCEVANETRARTIFMLAEGDEGVFAERQLQNGHRSRRRRVPNRRGASASRTLSICQSKDAIVVRLGSNCPIASRARRAASGYGATEPQPVKIVRSNRSARPGQSGGFHGGSMSTCSMPCSSALMQTHKPCASVARPSSIRSARRRPAWSDTLPHQSASKSSR